MALDRDLVLSAALTPATLAAWHCDPDDRAQPEGTT